MPHAPVALQKNTSIVVLENKLDQFFLLQNNCRDVDALNKALDQLKNQYNATGLEEFAGYSPLEMNYALNEPFHKLYPPTIQQIIDRRPR